MTKKKKPSELKRKQKLDFCGQKTERLLVVRKSHTKGKTVYWECNCDCGKTIFLTSSALSRYQKSCGCLKEEMIGSKHPSWRGVGDLSSSVYANMKSQSKHRGIVFDVSIEYLWNLFLKQEKKCALSGLELFMNAPYKTYINNRGTASLDRIQSNFGYIEGNCQWVHKDINIMKQNFSQEKFIFLANKITKKHCIANEEALKIEEEITSRDYKIIKLLENDPRIESQKTYYETEKENK